MVLSAEYCASGSTHLSIPSHQRRREVVLRRLLQVGVRLLLRLLPLDLPLPSQHVPHVGHLQPMKNANFFRSSAS